MDSPFRFENDSVRRNQRKHPDFLSDSVELSKNETELLSILASEEPIRPTQLDSFSDIWCLLTPEAFAYYLFKFIECQVSNPCEEYLLIDNLLLFFSRPINSIFLDAFFLERVKKLSSIEFDYLEKWLWWLIDCQTYNQDLVLQSLDVVLYCKDMNQNGWQSNTDHRQSSTFRRVRT